MAALLCRARVLATRSRSGRSRALSTMLNPDRSAGPYQTLPEYVRIYELGPRDGLQNEATLVDSSTKIRCGSSMQANDSIRIQQRDGPSSAAR